MGYAKKCRSRGNQFLFCLQIYQTSQSQMTSEIKEEELYDDLTICIFILRQKLAQILGGKSTPKQLNNNSEMFSIAEKINELTLKYNSSAITKPHLLKVIERFQVRIKDIIKQVSIQAPQQVSLILTLKQLQIMTIDPIKSQQAHTFIPNVLKVLQKRLHTPLSLLATPQRTKTHHIPKPSTPNFRSIQTPKTAVGHSRQKEISMRTISSTTENRRNEMKSQVEKVMRWMEQFSMLGLDKQYLRGQYFNLKENSNRDVGGEIVNRNKNIKNIIKNYEKEYEIYKDKYEKNKTTNQQQKTLNQTAKIPAPNKQFMAPFFPKKINYFDFQGTELSVILKSNTDTSRLEEYRSRQYESRLRSRKNRALPMNNIVIDVPFAQEEVSITQANLKKVQFYKKTQLLKQRFNIGRQVNNQTVKGIKHESHNPEVVELKW